VRNPVGAAVLLAGPIAAALAAGGCAQKRTVYDWGTYQDSLYTLWCRPENGALLDDIQRLTDQVGATRAAGRTPGPGVQAHIGYLHVMAGDAAAAMSWFRAEEADWPESAVFMHRLIAKVGR
jgi:hypothetical protein